jgi:hypothetical protein
VNPNAKLLTSDKTVCYDFLLEPQKIFPREMLGPVWKMNKFINPSADALLCAEDKGGPKAVWLPNWYEACRDYDFPTAPKGGCTR